MILEKFSDNIDSILKNYGIIYDNGIMGKDTCGVLYNKGYFKNGHHVSREEVFGILYKRAYGINNFNFMLEKLKNDI